jgi:hypothetical protein
VKFYFRVKKIAGPLYFFLQSNSKKEMSKYLYKGEKQDKNCTDKKLCNAFNLAQFIKHPWLVRFVKLRTKKGGTSFKAKFGA